VRQVSVGTRTHISSVAVAKWAGTSAGEWRLITSAWLVRSTAAVLLVSKLKPLATLEVTKVSEPTAVPLRPAMISFVLPSPGHHATAPVRSGEHEPEFGGRQVSAPSHTRPSEQDVPGATA
jgi:hypothetical protein